MSDEPGSEPQPPLEDASAPPESPTDPLGGEVAATVVRGPWYRRPRLRVTAGATVAMLLVVGVAVLASRGDGESGSLATASSSTVAQGSTNSSTPDDVEPSGPGGTTDVTTTSLPGPTGPGTPTTAVVTAKADDLSGTASSETTAPDVALTAAPESTAAKAPVRPSASAPTPTPSTASPTSTTAVVATAPRPSATTPSAIPSTTIPVVVPVPPSVSAYDFLSANPSVNLVLELVDDSPGIRAVLEGGGRLTLFAPSDDAIRAAGLSASDLMPLLGRHLLLDVGASTAQLGQEPVIVASDGSELVVDASGPILRVDGAEMYAPDNLVNNGDGYVHIVNSVLIPQS